MVSISLRAETLFNLGGLPISNSFLQSLLVSFSLIVVSVLVGRRLKMIPGTVQNLVELIMEKFLGLLESIFGSFQKAEKYLFLILTFFLFIILSNWSGLLPFVGAVGLREGREFIPLFRSPASDLNFTLALAVFSVLAINFLGLRALGAGNYRKRFFDFSGPVQFFVGLLELVSEFAKMISFSFRLFGNIFAGEVLLIIVGFLAPYFIPLPFFFLEIFVGFIQALIFAMLTSVFLSVAITSEH